MITVGQGSVFYWYDHLAAVCVCVCVCALVPSMGLEDSLNNFQKL